MKIRYFNAAWTDIKTSQNWFGKILLLALIMCIPVFGQIVVMGYLYGWARDIAWGVNNPLPKRIFGNEDGKLYSRGGLLFVLGLACMVIPWVLSMIQTVMVMPSYESLLYSGTYSSSSSMASAGSGLAMMSMLSSLIGFIAFVLGIALTFYQWVASMRISIYGTLSSGFQFKQVWKMMRKDFTGLLKIFGMYLLVGIIVGTVVGILVSFILLIVLGIGAIGAVGAVDSSSFSSSYGGYGNIFAIIGSLLLAVGIAAPFIIYPILVAEIFLLMLVTRALGYWTWQFDVPNWKGSKDPLPFETQVPVYTQPPNPYQQ